MIIWVIGRGFPNTFNGMFGSFELEQAIMIAKAHKVYYPCADFHIRKNGRKWGLEEFKKSNVQIIRYNSPLGRLPHKVLIRIKDYVLFRLMKRMEKEYGMPDIIHIHFPALVNHTFFRHYKNMGVKIVCTEHWTKVQTGMIEGRFLYSLKWFADNADAFICVGKHLKDSVEQLTGVSNIKTIPNIVPSYYFDVKPTRNDNSFVFIAVGRLVPVKQFDVLIEAFAKSFIGFNSIKLRIVGGGEEQEKLRKIITDYNMESQIELLGIKQRCEVAQCIADSDVLVCPSRLETFGVPVIEAMAAGKPFIGTEALGFLDQIPEGCGIIIDSRNKKELKEAMLSMYRNYSLYDSKLITEVARSNFSESAIMDRLSEIYNSLF